MIMRRVDLNRLTQEKDEMERVIQTNQEEFESCRDQINADMCEIEELESELSTMKCNVENMKQSIRELIELDEGDKKKLFEINKKLNNNEPEYIRPSEKERPLNESSLSVFSTCNADN